MPEKPEKSAREIVEEVLTPHMTRELWTINCQEVLPFTLQDFAVGGVLPAMLYMFRWGYRRGQGTFGQTWPQAYGRRRSGGFGRADRVVRGIQQPHRQGGDF
ncbi:MAG: hypothetical protein ACLQNE_38730 [Thermoguttaceae bacterium]